MKKLLNTLYVTSGNKYLSLDGENVIVLEEKKKSEGYHYIICRQLLPLDIQELAQLLWERVQRGIL